MQLDTVTEKGDSSGPETSRGSVLDRFAGRFRLALGRTRPYILAAGALYVGVFLVTFILRHGVILPEDRWLLGQPIPDQPPHLDVGFADWVYVFRHNVVADLLKIVTAGVPGIVINAYALGESAASAHAVDKAGIFWSVILPHGLLEIATSCVASGVGLRFGRSLLARIRHRADPRGGVWAALADGFILMLGLVVPATAVAALIEVELSTMWMPLPLAALFGAFAAATFVALIVGIRGPDPHMSPPERGAGIESGDANSAELAGGRELTAEERVARARVVLGDVAAGGPALDVVWKLAPRDARAACKRLVREASPAPDPITAAVAAGLARRYLCPRNYALWAAYLLSLWPVIALTDAVWAIASVPLWVLGAALTLRTIRGAKRSERISRELVDQAVGVEVAIRPPSTSDGFDAGFWEAVERKSLPKTPFRARVHVI